MSKCIWICKINPMITLKVFTKSQPLKNDILLFSFSFNTSALVVFAEFWRYLVKIQLLFTKVCAQRAQKIFWGQNFQDGWSYCHFSLGDHGHTGSMSEWWSWTLDFDQVMVGHSNLTPPLCPCMGYFIIFILGLRMKLLVNHMKMPL